MSSSTAHDEPSVNGDCSDSGTVFSSGQEVVFETEVWLPGKVEGRTGVGLNGEGEDTETWTSQAQWSGIHLPMQGTRRFDPWSGNIP